MPFKKRRNNKRKARVTRKEVAKIARKVVLGTAETKQIYHEVDEQTITPGTSGFQEHRFMWVERQQAGQMSPENEANAIREGAEILPQSFSFRGWMRPRALANDGTADQSKGDLFDHALYVRIIFLKVNTLGQTNRNPLPDHVHPSNNNFFLGKGGLPCSLETDYSDIYKPLNWKVTGKPLLDKVVFIPNQYSMNNTKLIKFSHKFPKGSKLTFEANGNVSSGRTDVPSEQIQMHVIARYANDDIHVQYENLELSGTGIFKFKDF